MRRGRLVALPGNSSAQCNNRNNDGKNEAGQEIAKIGENQKNQC
jgi:hypothetical protein